MATAAELTGKITVGEESVALAGQLRKLARAATIVAVLTSPALFVFYWRSQGWSLGWSIVATIASVAAFRGLVDVGMRRLIPWPSLFGTGETRLQEEDIVSRRRAWFWTRKYALVWYAFVVLVVVFVIRLLAHDATWATAPHTATVTGHFLLHKLLLNKSVWLQLAILPLFFLINFLILFGPLVSMGLSQMRGYEPGDANWGVRLPDVRGQAEAKEEVRKIVTLWQSGELFEKAGGKRERGLIFHGPPGTGKTMLAKAIATSFNAPFVAMPGSGFAQTFIGMDAVIVRMLARKAKKLARKWGGQCIVFIDEIDAVGMRRQSLGQNFQPDLQRPTQFYGPWGALNPSGDIIVETQEWRDWLFEQRAPERRSPYPVWMQKLTGTWNQLPGGMFGGGGQLALNQLLVVMDGMDNPPFGRRLVTNKINTWLDASYIVPTRVGRVPLRIPAPRPRKEQIYFVGATNVPLQNLDPALTRPGRMGRHVWFRTPTKDDRKDIFDLYLGKVAHDPQLDEDARRDEIARITNGYAQPLDARLLTPRGWTTMGAVAVGDELIGADGTATRVLAVHPRGELDVYRVTFNDGTSTECTADHLWTVEAADPRMLPKTFTLQELIDRGLRWSERGSRFYLPRLAPVEFEDSPEPPLDPYLLGLLLGDGGFTSTTPDFCTADAENLASVEAALPAGVAATQHGPMNWWLSSGGRGGDQRTRSNPLTERLRALQLWGVNGHEKFVPELYRSSDPDTRLAVLQGLMDTDGTRDYRRGTGPSFSSHSYRLAEDVAFLARSLGGTARVAPKRGGWRVAVDLPEGLIPFRLPRKAEAYRSSRKPFRKRILAVEHVGRAPVQCVTVDAPDGLYVTDGFTVTHNSPAMIEQACSMALSYAQHDGRVEFRWEDLLQAMSVIESGAAVEVQYVEHESRAIAIHEAGHAATAHVYRPEVESSRLSIKMRSSGSLGHHQSFAKEERFTSWNRELFADLIHGLGAMAAEYVFYGENSNGVGGDLAGVTSEAAWMVGNWGMAPPPLQVHKVDGETVEQTRKRVRRQLERVGHQLLNRTRGSADVHQDPIASILQDGTKRAIVAQTVGMAFVTAYNFIRVNKDKVETVANELIEKREIYGDAITELLDQQHFVKPEVDWTKDETWPPEMEWRVEAEEPARVR